MFRKWFKRKKVQVIPPTYGRYFKYAILDEFNDVVLTLDHRFYVPKSSELKRTDYILYKYD